MKRQMLFFLVLGLLNLFLVFGIFCEAGSSCAEIKGFQEYLGFLGMSSLKYVTSFLIIFLPAMLFFALTSNENQDRIGDLTTSNWAILILIAATVVAIASLWFRFSFSIIIGINAFGLGVWISMLKIKNKKND